VYLLTVFVLGYPGDRRGWQAVSLGAIGAVVIVAGNWPRSLPVNEQHAQVLILGMGLGSGIVYAGVIVFLRALREYSAAWLVMLNLIGSAIALSLFVLCKEGPTAWAAWMTTPTAAQLVVLAVFGVVQMATPYWLFARGLRTVGPLEAGLITLLEPLLNPVWAFLITPEKDTPTPPMYVGGALIFAALLWRYVPERAAEPKTAAR
jgi:drug/metabolite transporter (DMT)-like permease